MSHDPLVPEPEPDVPFKDTADKARRRLEELANWWGDRNEIERMGIVGASAFGFWIVVLIIVNLNL